MKKNSKYISIILLCLGIVSGTLFSACKKGFLDEKVRNQTPNDFFSNPEAPFQLVTAVYNQLYEWQQHSFSWIGVTSIASDDAEKGSDPGDTGTDKDQLDKFTFGPSSLSFNELWVSNFTGIAKANQALYYLPQLANVDPSYALEVKFLRAYYYFNLVRMFGGVPKVEKSIVTQEDIAKANSRASKEEIYAFIEQDLNEAMNGLPALRSPDEYGRATKGAAQALLAKVYLYQKKWAMAKMMADNIINSGQYTLLSDYSKIWKESGEFSSESIWEVNCKGSDPNKGITGYFVVQAPRGAGGLGWGFNTPSLDLYNTYEVGDVRRDATIMKKGQTLWDGYTVNTTAPNERYNYKSYISKTLETFNGNDDQTTKNLRISRLGEIYLIKAEAELEIGDTANAKAALNVIRNRAGLANTTAITIEEIRDAIYHERRVEMAFEHDRMFDLMRTGRAGATLRKLGIPFVDGKHELFPIPQRQIDMSAGKLTQNPGY